MNPLQHLVGAGLTLRADGQKLIVTPASILTDSLRDLIRQRKAELLELLAGASDRAMPVAGGTDISTPAKRAVEGEPGESLTINVDSWCWPHSGAMNTAELKTFAMRIERFKQRYLGDAEATALADRLVMRDRAGDDRKVCVECRWMGSSGRCIAAASGRLRGTDRLHEPVRDLLHRCEAFGGDNSLI